MEKMHGPESRSEFEHNINQLIEESEHITTASESAQQSFYIFTYPRLKEVRKLPNGRLDLNTVDESLRLNANTKNHMMNLRPLEGELEDTED